MKLKIKDDTLVIKVERHESLDDVIDEVRTSNRLRKMYGRKVYDLEEFLEGSELYLTFENIWRNVTGRACLVKDIT